MRRMSSLISNRSWFGRQVVLRPNITNIPHEAVKLIPVPVSSEPVHYKGAKLGVTAEETIVTVELSSQVEERFSDGILTSKMRWRDGSVSHEWSAPKILRSGAEQKLVVVVSLPPPDHILLGNCLI